MAISNEEIKQKIFDLSKTSHWHHYLDLHAVAS